MSLMPTGSPPKRKKKEEKPKEECPYCGGRYTSVAHHLPYCAQNPENQVESKKEEKGQKIPERILKKLLLLLKSEYSKWKNGKSSSYMMLIDDILEYFALLEEFQISRSQFNTLKTAKLMALINKEERKENE